MDLRQLAALTAVADHHSFSAAARALHTVQSNVSTHIANLALSEIGAKAIHNIDTDTTREAEACRRHYETTVRSILSRHPFSFAERPYALTIAADAPKRPAFPYVYKIPPRNIRIRIVSVHDSAGEAFSHFSRQGTFVYTKTAADHLIYIAADVPISEWDDLFIDAVKISLAERIARDITDDDELASAALSKFEKLGLPVASFADTRENSSGENRGPADAISRSPLVRSRRSSSNRFD